MGGVYGGDRDHVPWRPRPAALLLTSFATACFALARLCLDYLVSNTIVKNHLGRLTLQLLLAPGNEHAPLPPSPWRAPEAARRQRRLQLSRRYPISRVQLGP